MSDHLICMMDDMQCMTNDMQCMTNDISELNNTRVKGIIMVRSEQDILQTITRALKEKRHISMRGTHHTMGGQTIAKDGYVLDMTRYNKIIEFNRTKHEITVQPGILWSDLIKFLNQYGQSPMIMQSYSTFSVGGTIAVNAHGITSDYGMYHCIISMRVILSNGQINTTRSGDQLFAHVIGGYGLFGVISEVTLKTVDNTTLEMTPYYLTVPMFHKWYQAVIHDKSIVIRTARINLTNLDEIICYQFRAKDSGIISKLNDQPNQMSLTSQLMYKWLMPISFFQRARFFIEKLIGTPLDSTEVETRNSLMYESAKPLAELYNPIIKLNVTHILQEYFVPQEHFIKWMTLLKQHLPLILTLTTTGIKLLNITIRYVKKDVVTALPYAKRDMYAFVFYYRINKSHKTDKILERIHQILTNNTLKCNGTFYLPYRFHYTYKNVMMGYPEIFKFFYFKQHYDASNLFSNCWFKKMRKLMKND